jgi:hypothetical protein
MSQQSAQLTEDQLKEGILALQSKDRRRLAHWLSETVALEQHWNVDAERHKEIRRALAIPADPVALSDVETDFYISQYEEHTEQGRHLETERSTVTNIVGAVAAAILVFMGTKEFHPDRLSWFLPLAPLMLAALGLYGYQMTKVLYDRIRKSMDFAYGFRYVLEKRLSAKEAETLHGAVSQFYTKDIRLHKLWPAFNLTIAIIGVVLSAIAVVWVLRA